MKFGIDADCTKAEMEEIYDQFVEVMLLTDTTLGDCFLEDQKDCYLENHNYCMFEPKGSPENLSSMLYDLHLDYPNMTYFQK